MSHPLIANPRGLDSFAQGWDGFWKRLTTPESVKAWDDYFAKLDGSKPFDWQFVGLWDMGRRVRWIQFQCPPPGARERSGRIVDQTGSPLTPELQRLEMVALQRQIQRTHGHRGFR